MRKGQEDKAQGDLINVYKYLKGGCKEKGARLFSLVPSERTTGNEMVPSERTMGKEYFFLLKEGD